MGEILAAPAPAAPILKSCAENALYHTYATSLQLPARMPATKDRLALGCVHSSVKHGNSERVAETGRQQSAAVRGGERASKHECMLRVLGEKYC